MSWQTFESAVRSVFSQNSDRSSKSKHRPTFRPALDALEDRLVPTTYSTNFPLTENPISEGGHWINGKAQGIDWGNVNTTPGYAVGVTGPSGFADATALLTGTWGPDQSAQATVRVAGSVFDHPEVELRLRSSISAHVNNGYEITESVAGAGNDYLIIVRWNGPLNDFTYLTVTNPGGFNGPYSVTTGDVVKATIVGNVISAYKNGVLIGQATDNTYTSGNPGFGFNTGINGDYGYINYSASDGSTTKPAPPTGLNATAANAAVALTWNASSGATSYNLYRSTGTAAPTLFKTGLTATSYADTGLTNGTQYNYEVTAVNTAGESGVSNEVSATPQPVAPPIPGGLTAAPGNALVSLSWNASVGAASYNIYRSTGTAATALFRTGITATAYSDTGLTNGTQYNYQVSAVNTAGESGKSSVVSATPQAKPPGHVQTNAADVSSASNSVAFTSATTAGDLVVAEISFNNNVNFSSITDSQGNTWVQIGTEQNSTSFGIKSRLYYAKNIRGGPLTVTSQLSGTPAYHELYIHEYSGLDTTNPLDAFSVNTATGTSFTSNNLTTTAANDLLYGIEIDSASASAAAGWTTRSTLDGNVAADKSAAAVGTYAFTGSSSGAYMAWVAAFKPASGSANQPPTVATAASASPSTVSATTALSVLGADDGGEANLTYTWAATSVPSGATPTFSVNGTNGAKNSTVTLNKVGSYTFQVTIKDAGGLTATSSVNVTVNQTLTSIAVSPATASVADGATQAFAATAKDQFGNALTTQPTFTWSIDSGGAGSVNSSSGLYKAPTNGSGTATVRATSGSVSGTASVTVNNQPPTVATPASASPGTVAGTTTAISVLGADDGGEANLTYTWAATSVPSGASPTYSANGTNAAKNSTVTFNKAGSYTFQVTIKDAGGLTATSSVNVTVNQTLTSISDSPTTATVADSATQQFRATAKDQFGNALSTQPTFSWTVDSGGLGSVSSSGLYTAPGSGAGSATVRATSGSVSGTAAVTVTQTPPVESPYGGVAWSIPGTIQAENYDNGGEGVAYHDRDATNNGGAYRTDGVDIQPTSDTGGGYNVGWIQAGEWLKYTVNVATAGSYDLSLRLADTSAGGALHVEVDGVNVSGTLSVPNTGGWQTWTTVTKTGINLTAGQHIVKVAFDTNGSNGWVGNLNWFGFAPTAVNQPPAVATAARASANPVTGTSTNLSALGADDGGEANLTYAWAATTVPSGVAPTFSANGTNAAKSSTVTFNKAGNYTFQVTIKDVGGLTTTSSVSLTVNQTLTSIGVSPATATVADSATQQFSATGKDQFGNALGTQPAFTWSVDSGGLGAISGSGLYTAPASGSGTATVRATSGSLSGTASVTVTKAAGWGYVQTNAVNTSSASTAVTLSSSSNSGGLVIVEVSWSSTASFTSITDNQGNTYVQIGAEQHSTGFGISSRLYYAKNIKGGPLTVTSLLSSSPAYHETYVHEYSGLDVTNPLDAYSVNVATGTSFTSNNLTTTVANDLLYGIDIDSGTGHAAAGWTTRSTLDNNVAADENAPVVGSYAFTGSSSGAFISWVAAFKPASPEMLAGTPLTGSHAPSLTRNQLDRVVAEAIADWAATGLSAAQIATLQHVKFVIADLPGGMLGQEVGNTIYIDTNAAGNGWSLGQRVAPDKVDLLTVVAHELGHELGLPDLDTQAAPANVMDGTLAPGVRRLPFDSSAYVADASGLDMRWPVGNRTAISYPAARYCSGT